MLWAKNGGCMSIKRSNKLSAKQQHALELLLSGCTVNEVAEKAQVRRETVWRWLQEPSFVSPLQKAQDMRKFALTMSLSDGASEAITALRMIVCDETIGAMARVRAAKEILDRCGFGSEQTVKLEGILNRKSKASASRKPREAEMTKDSCYARRFVRGSNCTYHFGQCRRSSEYVGEDHEEIEHENEDHWAV